MKIIQAGFEILRPNTEDGGAGREAIYRMIETAARTCYKSEGKIGSIGDSARFVQTIVMNHHEAMLEHASMTVRFTVDRAIANEIVRHRLAGYAQESTRWCNYSKEQHEHQITVIRPCYLVEGTDGYAAWYAACATAESMYFQMLNFGCSPEQARAVLPLSTKTELIMTANMREWRHFLKVRAAGETGRPHPQMLEVTKPLLAKCREYLPELFFDVEA